MALAQEIHDLASGKAIADDSIFLDMEDIVFHPPAGDSAKILCVTMNYSSHAKAFWG